MKYIRTLVFSILFLLGSSAESAFAQTSPAIQNLTASPLSISSGLLMNLSWTLETGTGYSYEFTCPAGVSVLSASGSAVPCGAKQSVTSAGSDSLGFSFINISGASQRVYVRVYPKDGAGADYTAGSALATFTVSPVPSPISDFSATPLSLASGGTLTFTWASHYLPGVNVRFDCTNDLLITSAQSTLVIPCNGAMAFTSALAPSGSQDIVVTNRSAFATPLSIKLFPVIAAGQYDGINVKTVDISVAGQLPEAEASTVSFVASSTVLSNATSTFVWVTKNARGSNVQIACTEDTAFFDGNNTELRCGSPAFAVPFRSASSTSIRMQNKGTTRKVVRITLLLERQDGTYVPAAGRDVSVMVLMPGENQQPSASTPPLLTAVASTTLTQVTPLAKKPHAPLTVTLRKGMRHKEVIVLQTFLALDPNLYPEASVSNYFGSATEMAVKRFQKRYGIAKEGNSAFGIVGPSTRARMNVLTTP